MTVKKNIFYERVEDENEIRITWATAPTVILYSVITLFIVLSAFSRYYPAYENLLIGGAKVLLVLLLVFSVVYYATTRQINAESREAMRRGNIKLEGGRLSFKKPFTCVISKIKTEDLSEAETEPVEPEDPEYDQAAEDDNK